MSGTAPRPLLIDCAQQQLRVIGALVIRELRTRFGQRRLGYVWLFVEPLLFSAAIVLIHGTRGRFSGEGLRTTFEFFAIGYLLFFKFRSIVNRAGNAIGANRSLLFHRQVTLPDLFVARHVIEGIAVTGVLAVFVVAAVAMGGEPPDSPIQMICALGLMLLLAQGIAFIVGALTAEWDHLDRIIMLLSILMLPFCGVFFMVEWLPEWMQDIVLWIPTVHVFELLREGQFGDRVSATYDLRYLASWILVPHLLGLAALRITRQRIGLE